MGKGTEIGEYYRRRYLGYTGELTDGPRKIAWWATRIKEAREKGLAP